MPKEEQRTCHQNVSLDPVVTSVQEHHAPWAVPARSHEPQHVTETGTEKTEVCMQRLLCCERSDFPHPVHLHTVPPWAISGALPRQSSLKKRGCQCCLDRTGTNFLIFLRCPSKLQQQQQHHQQKNVTVNNRSVCSQCHTANVRRCVWVCVGACVCIEGGARTQLWAHSVSITVWQRVELLIMMDHIGTERKFVIFDSWTLLWWDLRERLGGTCFLWSS